MSGTVLYLIGFVILILGVAYGASLLGVSDRWIMVIVLILLGIGIATAVTSTRRREPPGEE